MEEFLYWGQVQQGLTDYLEKNGTLCSFYDMARTMWQDGLSTVAQAFPNVSFEEWDIADLDQFDRLFGQTPVDLSLFYTDFRRNQTAAKAAEPVMTLDVIPYRLAWDQKVGQHLHVSFEVLYIMRGDAVLDCGGTRRQLSQGTLCILSPNLRHDVIPQRGSQVISVMLAGATLENALSKLLRQESVLSDFFHAGLSGGKTGYMTFFVPEEEPVRKILRSLFHEYYMRGEYAQQICENYAEILFAQVLRQCGGLYERHSESAERRGTLPVLAVLKYIQTNYRTTSLGEVAAWFHYEPSYLGKLIKANTGKSYTTIVRELRLDEAKRLLQTTELGMDKVSERAGYNNQVHFFREFRNAFGETPGEYRSRKSRAGGAKQE